MKKHQFTSLPNHLYLLIVSLLFFSACAETPENFFDIAILNTNIVNDFASPDLARHLEEETKEFADIPSSKKKGDEAATSVSNKILYLEQSLEKVKKLSASGEEEQEIKERSISLYQLVIPVYKNEYMAYAKLCDAKADQDKKNTIIRQIDEKYRSNFEQKYDALLEKGKIYAKEHNIQVSWGQ